MVLDQTVDMMALSHSYRSNGTHNTTIDVIRKGCFTQFSPVACIRNGTLSLFVILTALFCVVKIIKLHVRQHPTLHQYIIFYCATIECIVCATHLILGRYSELTFVTQYLKLVQFVVVCHFYWTLASRVMRKEILSKWLLLPAVFGALVYFTVVTVYGIVTVQSSWVECLQPQWMMMSSVEFILVQLFFVAGFYISRRLNEISTLRSVRWAQKRDLWGIIMVFELSALIGLVYDVTTRILGDEFSGCSGVFLHMEEIYSPVFVAFMTVKYLLPIWVMLCVFHPVEANNDQDELLPVFSEDGNYTSVFSPSVNQIYKPLFLPGSASPVSDMSPPTASSSWNGSPRRRTSILEPIKEELVSSSLPETMASNSSVSQEIIVSTSSRLRGVQV